LESDVPNFKQRINVLFEKYHALSTILNDHVCDLLEIPSTAISSYTSGDNITFQSGLWHHAPDTESRTRDGLEEPQEHHDMDGFVTLMTQFQPGLQAKNKEGTWIDIPYVPGGVICMIGRQLMRLTGGRFASTAYRVNTAELEQDRYAISYALSTRADKAVVVHPQLESPGLSSLPGPSPMRVA